jgi:hypothetical protein
MKHHSCSRRAFLQRSGTACAVAGGALLSVPNWSIAKEAAPDIAELISRIKDPEIRAGVKAAVEKNILPACVEHAYTGYFYITADGGSYGGDATWPGLDSWQMAGALLLLGRTRIVEDYFDYVRASQRKDGNIPLAIFPERKPENTCLRTLKWPDDVFSYTPPKREGVPASGQQTRKWIGMFEHWQNMGDPLSTLGPVCYILTAAEIFDATNSLEWLNERLSSIERTGSYLLGRKSKNGLISGSGFYSEQPPRLEWDGVTQCYVVHAFRELARLLDAAGKKSDAAKWNADADAVTKSFSKEFWRTDHFGEYLHPEHGPVDSHGLSDTNWAAVAFGVASDEQLKALWPRLMAAKEFWFADMPTQSVTKPFAYEPWEQNFGPPCPVPPLADVAAMGRVWYLEAMACQRMKANERLVESVRKVCKAAKDGYWRERYHPQKDGKVTTDGAQRYCEYPAVLVRVVLGNRELFCT